MGKPESCPYAVAGELDPLSGTLGRSFGEFEQDLLLSCLTVGKAYGASVGSASECVFAIDERVRVGEVGISQ